MESGVLAFCAFLRTELAPAASVQHSPHPLAFPLFQERVETVEPRWSTMGPQNGGAQFVESRKVGMRGGNQALPENGKLCSPGVLSYRIPGHIL